MLYNYYKVVAPAGEIRRREEEEYHAACGPCGTISPPGEEKDRKTRNWETVTQGRIKGVDHPTRRRIQGADIVKGWDDKRDHGRIPDTIT